LAARAAVGVGPLAAPHSVLRAGHRAVACEFVLLREVCRAVYRSPDLPSHYTPSSSFSSPASISSLTTSSPPTSLPLA
jgi:hypothetical protein